MKHGLLIIGFLLFLSPFAIAQKSLDSRITAVTVYQDRALVTRTASWTVSEGTQSIAFDGLPEQILDDSITASPVGAAKIEISGIEVHRSVLNESPEKEVNDLTAQIQAVVDEIADMEAQSAVLDTQKTFLDSLRAGYTDRVSKDFTSRPPGVADLGQMVDFLGVSLLKIGKDARKLEIQKREATNRKDNLSHQLSLLTNHHATETKSVNVVLVVKSPGSLNLAISYVITGAGWIPIYDARLSQNGDQVEMQYKGLVTQQTGEDWNNVDLSLSTARAATGGDAPQLYPWQIHLLTPEEAQRRRNAINVGGNQSGQQNLFTKKVAVTGEAPVVDTKAVETQQTSVLFHINRKETIPSDPAPNTTSILVFPLATDLEYLAVPKASPYVYLRSQVKNTSQAPLLPGKVNVFMGSSFVGNSSIGTVAPNEEFRIYFGVDEGIKVKREETVNRKEAGSFSGNRKSYSYTITVENFKQSPQRISVLDQIPMSDNEKLEVKMQDVSPTPVEQDTKWMLKWILNVNPGEKKEIRYGFDVEYPKDREVDGL